MNKKIIMITMLLMALPVFADQCLTSVDGTTSVSANVTTGTDVHISVTPSGTCSNGEISLQLTYSNCSLTVNDPPSPGYYSSVSAGAVKTFTVTSGTKGICTITARGTTNDGTVDDNTPIIIEFTDPSSLVITGVPDSASISQNANFTLTINVTNPQPADTFTSFLLTMPSSLDRLDGDEVSGLRTVYGGGTKPFSWIIKHTTCFTGTKTVTFQLGDNANAFSTVVTGNSSCSSGSSSSNSSSSSSGIGGSNTTTKSIESKLFSGVAGAKQTLVFTQVTGPGITQVELTFATSISGGNISLSAGINPGAVPIASSDGLIYSYPEFTETNVVSSQFSDIKIRFKVPAVWLSANSIDQQKIYLYRYAGGQWNRLDTIFKSNDSSNSFYEADSPGFSTFAIGGYKTGTSVPVSTVSGTTPSITIISPTAGTKLNSSTVVVQLSASGITLAEPQGNNVSGEAHFHVWIDDLNEQSGAGTTFTFENVSIGDHTLKIELRNGNNTSLDPPILTIIRFEVVAPEQVLAASADFAIGYVILIILVAATAFYFFKVKHISLKSAKYFAKKSAERAHDFMPSHFKEVAAKEVKAAETKPGKSLGEFISRGIKSVKSVRIDFAPKNIEKFISGMRETKAADPPAQAASPAEEKKKEEPEGGYSFAS